jgi:hypothetical protein
MIMRIMFTPIITFKIIRFRRKLRGSLCDSVSVSVSCLFIGLCWFEGVKEDVSVCAV